jgi:hypothetical protein
MAMESISTDIRYRDVDTLFDMRVPAGFKPAKPDLKVGDVLKASQKLLLFLGLRGVMSYDCRIVVCANEMPVASEP